MAEVICSEMLGKSRFFLLFDRAGLSLPPVANDWTNPTFATKESTANTIPPLRNKRGILRENDKMQENARECETMLEKSAFSPVPTRSPRLLPKAPPHLRSRALYNRLHPAAAAPSAQPPLGGMTWPTKSVSASSAPAPPSAGPTAPISPPSPPARSTNSPASVPPAWRPPRSPSASTAP